ncbi:DUF5994 family protein [Nucisporomicrobium flavum]|uniref:DUF5994 family protein n=1 Tax=Nucisporomicrobium flavum TaxID=2785915 RepID=UPI003556C13A
MTSPNVQPSSRPPLVRFEPFRLHRTLFDGRWGPRSADPTVELPALIPLLDRINGPVCRLRLSVAGWATRPQHIVVADRTIGIGYFPDQPPATLTALCADGTSAVLLISPAWPPGQPRPESETTTDERSLANGEDRWESEGGQPAGHRGNSLR